MRILITGGSGFLGEGIVRALIEHHEVVNLDIRESNIPSCRTIKGSVADLSVIEKACLGADAIVISHMLPRTPASYKTTLACFDVNVKGTAHLLQTAAMNGIFNIVLISSVSTMNAAWKQFELLENTSSYSSDDLYGLTKVCQEMIARHFCRNYPFKLAALRLPRIVDRALETDKRDRAVTAETKNCCDRHFAGKIVLEKLEHPQAGFRTFFLNNDIESISTKKI